MSDEQTRRPTTFRLDDPAVRMAPLEAENELHTEAFASGVDGDGSEGTARAVRRRGMGIGGIFLSATSALVVFGMGIWVTDFVARMFERAGWLGWTASGLAACAGLALLALLLREIVGLMRLARMAGVRAEAELAAASDDQVAARDVVRKVIEFYISRPDTARARAALKRHAGEIIDGRNLLRLAEKELIAPLDAQARGMITASAQRVSLVTAVSPRALIDIAFVLYESVRLVRRIGALYGGRPSGLSMVRLMRMTIVHLTVTGGVAMTDSALHQVVGHSLAARLSARLGEGVINGLMVGRIGLAALDVCRPLPWIASEPPGLSGLMSTLVGTVANKSHSS
jgi:putative membrane protein